MVLSDLKVENASVRVSNANEVDSVYQISANFSTREGKLVGVNGGQVMKGSEREADFWANLEGTPSRTITYYGEAHNNKDMQDEINNMVNDFIDLATAKAQAEAAE